MRIFTFFLILLVFSTSDLLGNAPDSALMAERDYYFKQYKSVRDTMTINTWLNLKRLSDNLEEIVQIDQIILDQYIDEASTDTFLVKKDSGSLIAMANLELKMEQLEARTINDMRMLLILKTAAGMMILIILLFLYLLINEKSKLNRLKNLYAFADRLSVEKRKENIALEAELEKLRKREQDFRTELEKGLITHQDKLMMLQKKNLQLETELKKIREQLPAKDDMNFSLSDASVQVPNLPNSESEVKELMNALSEERNSLMRLAGRLQKQLEAEKGKYQELMGKIKSITGNNSAENTGS